MAEEERGGSALDYSQDSSPSGSVPIAFTEFAGLNTESNRAAIDDREMAWCDGFMPIGRNTLRTMPGFGPQIFLAPSGTTVGVFGFGNIGQVVYCISVLSDGSMWATNTTTLAAQAIAGPGTIQTPLPGGFWEMTQWGSQFLLIVASNGYWVWDGTTLYGAGATVPGFDVPMPTGIIGGAIEIFGGRVWIANGATITFSAAESITDFSTGNGGGSFSSVDSFVKYAFTRLVQTNGFLYLVADSSINYVSNVQQTGNPPITTFTNQNADPEIGTPNGTLLQTYSHRLVFGNAFGVHAMDGGTVTKVSDQLDGVYDRNGLFGSGKAIVFGKRLFILLMRVINPTQFAITNTLFCWDGRRWWSYTPVTQLNFIAASEFNSDIKCYGTDGQYIYELFGNAGTVDVKTVQSKLFAGPGGLSTVKVENRLWALFDVNALDSPPQPVTVTIDNEVSAPASYTFTPTAAGVYITPPQAIAQNGVLCGMTITTKASDLVLVRVTVDATIVQYRG